VTGSYWERVPSSHARSRFVDLRLPDFSASLLTASGVFGARRLDRGTLALLRHVHAPEPRTAVVDLGAGYGPIAVTLAHRQPRGGVWAVDVNERALGLARANAGRFGLANIVVAEPEQVPAGLRFDGLYSNPPIKVGKDLMRELVAQWLDRLVPGGLGWLVVKQAMGADSLHAWLDDKGYPTERAASKQGYRILKVGATPSAGPPRAKLGAADLDLVGRQTGGTWTMLGHLTGGWSGDQVYLVGRGPARAVLKLKHGAWWVEQLGRVAETVDQLRALRYPTPPVLGFGRLDDERCFLLTGFVAGRTVAALNNALLEQVLDAIGRHAQVRPAPKRDWSAMVTAFLNGGIADFAFDPIVLPLATRALGAITRPVPALPTGDFVHGDFTLRNMLVDNDGLSAIVDLEGFGVGTRVIDLVALLQTAADTRHGDPAMARRLADEALAVAGSEVFAACVAHRVLAVLADATERPAALPDAQARAEALLRMLR
jgi:16S rRNA (guanine1207-N2)-methyltransferase